MPRTEKYFVGPKLLSDIRDTITRVAGMPDSSSGAAIRSALQEMPRRGGAGGFRICTFTGAWNKNATKTVTLRGVTATPNTLAVLNLFANLTGPTSGNLNCAAARDGTAWYLIAAEC